MNDVAQAIEEARREIATEANEILPDTCRLKVEDKEYERVPCKFKGGSGNVDGASYQIRFAWDSPAVVGAVAVSTPFPDVRN